LLSAIEIRKFYVINYLPNTLVKNTNKNSERNNIFDTVTEISAFTY